MNFHPNKEINNLHYGDIVVVYWNNDWYVENDQNLNNTDLKIELYFLSPCKSNLKEFLFGLKRNHNFSKKEIDEMCFHPLDESSYGEEEFSFFSKEIHKNEKIKLNVDLTATRILSDKHIFEIKKTQMTKLLHDGMKCCQCKDFFPMAEPNLLNGDLVCYSCRDTYGWKYSNLYIGK